MDAEERYYSLKTDFYMYKSRLEIIYFVSIILYCSAILGFVIMTKEKFPDIYMNNAMKVILFVLLIIGMTAHYVMKYLFYAKFRYTKYYAKACSSYSDADISEIRDMVTSDAAKMRSPHKDPFIRTVSFYLDNRGSL